MEKVLEITRSFYGVLVPESRVKKFLRLVKRYLDNQVTIETAIGLTLNRLHIK